MPEEALEEIASHLEKAKTSTDETETSYHINSAQQMVDVALHRAKLSKENDSEAALAPDRGLDRDQ
jgi:hypothetical protein